MKHISCCTGRIKWEKRSPAGSRIDKKIKVILNDVEIKFAKPLIKENDRVLVPIRAIAEAMGATVAWDEGTQTATITSGVTVINLTLNSAEMTVGGKMVALDVAAKAVNGRTLVPVRAVSEAFGAEVRWSEAEQTVYLTPPKT